MNLYFLGRSIGIQSDTLFFMQRCRSYVSMAKAIIKKKNLKRLSETFAILMYRKLEEFSRKYKGMYVFFIFQIIAGMP